MHLLCCATSARHKTFTSKKSINNEPKRVLINRFQCCKSIIVCYLLLIDVIIVTGRPNKAIESQHITDASTILFTETTLPTTTKNFGKLTFDSDFAQLNIKRTLGIAKIGTKLNYVIETTTILPSTLKELTTQSLTAILKEEINNEFSTTSMIDSQTTTSKISLFSESATNNKILESITQTSLSQQKNQIEKNALLSKGSLDTVYEIHELSDAKGTTTKPLENNKVDGNHAVELLHGDWNDHAKPNTQSETRLPPQQNLNDLSEALQIILKTTTKKPSNVHLTIPHHRNGSKSKSTQTCDDGSMPEFSVYGGTYCWVDTVCPRGTICTQNQCCLGKRPLKATLEPITNETKTTTKETLITELLNDETINEEEEPIENEIINENSLFIEKSSDNEATNKSELPNQASQKRRKLRSRRCPAYLYYCRSLGECVSSACKCKDASGEAHCG